MKFSSGGGQTLFVAVGVHSEAAVAAAPVVAIGGKTVRETSSEVKLCLLSLCWRRSMSTCDI